MKIGDLVRYTPNGRVHPNWPDWYGLVIRPDPHADFMIVVRWSKDNNNTISIRKKDLTVINKSP